MLLSADSRQSPRSLSLSALNCKEAPTPRNDPLRYCRELAHFPPAAGRPGRPVLLSRQVTIVGEVRAIEADRLILLAGTVVRIPLGLHIPRIPPAVPRVLLGVVAGTPTVRRRVEMDNSWNNPWKLDCDRDHKECRRTRPSRARVTVFP